MVDFHANRPLCTSITPCHFRQHKEHRMIWYRTQQMKTCDIIGLQDEVEGRFVDLITPLEHDPIIFEYTELLLESVR